MFALHEDGRFFNDISANLSNLLKNISEVTRDVLLLC